MRHQHLIQKIKLSPFGEFFYRYKEIYSALDKRGKKILLLLQVSHVISNLMQTLAVGGMAGFLIILSKPKIVLDNHYIASFYNFFEFEQQGHFLLLVSGFLVLLIVIQQIVFGVVKLFNVKMMEGLTRRCTVMLYRYYLTESYENHIRRGATLAIAKNLGLVNNVINGEVTKLQVFIAAVVNAIFIFFVLFVVHLLATVALLGAALGFYGLFFLLFKKKSKRIGKQLYQYHIDHVRMVREGVGAVDEIKLMGKERDFINRIDNVLISKARGNVKKVLMNYIPNASSKVIGMVVLYIIAALIFLSDDREHVFSILTLFAAGSFRLLPLLGGVFSVLLAQEESFYRYRALIDDLQAAKKYTFKYDKDVQFNLVKVKEQVVFDDVTYTYPETDKPVIQNFNFSFPANKIIALVGYSGVGKSTLIRLVSGLLTPQSGQVFVDGKSLQNDEDFKRDWQKSAGITFQNPFFMNATLAMNIAFEATEEKIDYDRVREVVKIAHLEDFVESLPDGVYSEISEDAGILSGGQRQRVAIARSLYRDSSVLILDEATNALDLTMERKIINSLAGLKKNKLIIIIAHRLETMRFADVVLYMKKNYTIAQGDFDKLLKEDVDFKLLAELPESFIN